MAGLKMKMEMAKEKQKNESMGKKICIAICAAAALSYSGVLAYFFYAHYTDAELLAEETPSKFTCSPSGHSE